MLIASMSGYYRRLLTSLRFVAANILLGVGRPALAMQHNEIVTSVEQAQQLIRDYRGNPQDFQLAVPLNKPLLLRGKPVLFEVAMAVITDGILAKGWMPNGFVDKRNVRYYHYSR